jgi:hypothetical protein
MLVLLPLVPLLLGANCAGVSNEEFDDRTYGEENNNEVMMEEENREINREMDL